ncbi:MAG TPA: hypothetical protein VF718_03265 [Allosphingosinicella sp.]|jgi:hypothetical protein
MDGRTKRGLAIAGVLGLAGAGAMLWSLRDLGTNYAPVRATVVAVTAECTLERTRYDRQDNPIEDREGPMGCGEAERMRRDRPGFRDFGLRRQRIVEVRYVSPADGRVHVGTIRPRQGYLEGSVPGAEVEIVAHKRKPGEVGLRP